jgi:hypothetical protein
MGNGNKYFRRRREEHKKREQQLEDFNNEWKDSELPKLVRKRLTLIDAIKIEINDRIFSKQKTINLADELEQCNKQIFDFKISDSE